MAATQSPLVGLNMPPEVAKYVAMLEHSLGAYAVQEAKFRALLELITGESWDDVQLDMNGNVLQDIATEALMKATGTSRVKAKTLVAKRWNGFNPTPTPKSVGTEEFIAATMQSNPKATNVIEPPTMGSMSQRLAAWRERNTRQTSEQDRSP